MRILATCDFHGDANSFRKTALKAEKSDADVIVVCGDITHFGTLQQARELLRILRDTQAPVLLVPGNCDPPTLIEERLDRIESIHGRCRQVNEINFLGVGGSSVSPFNTPFELQEAEIASVLERALSSCEAELKTVLLSHDPPKDTALDVTFAGDHVGSVSVREFIEVTSPTVVVCGHIHEAAGVDRVGSSVVVNPGPARHGRCALVSLNMTATVELDHL